MLFGGVLAFFTLLVCPLLLECTTTCQMGNPTDYVEGHCPVTLTSVPSLDSAGFCTEYVTVHVWMKAEDFCKDPKIEIRSEGIICREIIKPTMKKRKNQNKCDSEKKTGELRVECDRGVTQPDSNASFALWELVHTCPQAKASSVVSVTYRTASNSCSVSYTVPDPIPDFDFSVNQSSKSVSITVEPGDKVYARWCFQIGWNCRSLPFENVTEKVLVDPSQSRSALLNVPYLLPCSSVQVYYTHRDSNRHTKRLFQSVNLTDFRDVWLSANIQLFKSELIWRSWCSASDMKISASLCWMQREHLCTPVLNSTQVPKDGERNLKYDISAVDTHPQMCVQFSLQGSQNVSCHFTAVMSSWEVFITPGRQGVFLDLVSSVRAKFSAQLCVLDKMGCIPRGQVHSVTMEGNETEVRMNVPLHFLDAKPCVQVWRSDPALHGRRILCPDYTHNRFGMYAVAALVFVVTVALLGIFIQRLTKRGAAVWLRIQEPVLLVCSSEQSAHVSVVCALASILQGELCATVHMALWAQSSQTQTRTGVADLGPLPWLYGQWEAVRKAQGKMLIIWSPEAKKTYEQWEEERANMDKNERKMKDYSKAEVRHGNMRVEVDEDLKLNRKKMEKCKIDCVKLCDDKNCYTQREASTVIAPVFTAALACLEGSLQEGKGQGVALVYFQGLCHSRDIPKAFRGVPRYSLPQDFRGLIQELGGMRRQTKSGKFRWQCWPRLLSKVLSIWMARQLAHRLQTLLPQTQGKSVTSSLKMMSDKTRSRLKLPVAADMTRPGTVPEHEPLHVSPW